MIERYSSTASSVPSAAAASSSLLLLLSTILLLSSSRTASAESSVICPIAGATDVTTNLDTFDPVARYSEISGLALSKEQVSDLGNPILFGVSDIGGGARLGIWDSGTGQRLLSLNIPEPNNGTSILEQREVAGGFIVRVPSVWRDFRLLPHQSHTLGSLRNMCSTTVFLCQ